MRQHFDTDVSSSGSETRPATARKQLSSEIGAEQELPTCPECVGSSREVAEKVRRELEARLALGDLGVFIEGESQAPTFDAYTDRWLKDYARMEYKTSSADGYEGVLRQYLRPRFGKRRLGDVTRDDVKAMVNDLIAADLSRNTIRNALCVIRGMFNHAIEAGTLESNPAAARLGRFTILDRPQGRPLPRRVGRIAVG